MSQAQPKTIEAATAGTINRERPLAVSLYDQMAALLVAGLFILGIIVTLLFIVWLTNQVWDRVEAIPIYLEEPAGGEAPLGDADDLEEPGDEEVEDLNEPQLQETLTAITDAISSQQATLDSLDGDARSSTKGKGRGSRSGVPGGTGTGTPRGLRWQIQYDATDLKSYAAQLDFFGVELAVLRSNDVDYCFHLTKSVPDKRTGPPDNERLYFRWQHGPLQAADRDLLKKAGIPSGRIMLQYYSKETENLLAHVEHQALNGRPLASVKRTVFGVQQTGDKYEFVVLDLKTRATY